MMIHFVPPSADSALHRRFEFIQLGELRALPDIRAAWTSALIMLPQAVVLAALAGLPPEAGIYASVFPVVIAALVGASPRLLSGPNTAVAVMIGSALTPFATPFGVEYIQLALVLSALVGLVQLFSWLCRAGRLFEIVPDCIVHGVTLGVGMVIVGSQLHAVLGVLSVPGEAPWLSVWYAAAALDRANGHAVIVAVISVASGCIVAHSRLRRWVPPLIAALAGGSLCAFLFDLAIGSATVNLDRIGHISLLAVPLSLPHFAHDELYVVKQLLQSAFAIALIGALQTVIIARTFAEQTGDSVNAQREILAQGTR